MRVTLFISSLACGGAENSIVTLAEHLVKLGHQVTLITAAKELEKRFFEIPGGVEHMALGIIPEDQRVLLKRIPRYFEMVSIVRTAFVKAQPDIIVAFLDWTNVLAAIASLGLGKPLIVSERTVPRYSPANFLYHSLRYVVYPFASGITAVCQDAFKDMFVMPWQHTAVLPGPVRPPVSSWTMTDRGAFRIMSVGRLSEEKGFDLIIRAVALLKRDCPDIQCTIFGDGVDRDALLQLCRELGVEDRFAFPGRTQDPYSHMNDFDLFISSSRFEGYPRALAEAMMFGMPVIACLVPGGVRDMMVPNENGLVLEKRTPEALAEAIRRLYSDMELGTRLGSNARSIAAQCSVDTIVPRWMNLLETILSKRTSRN